MNKWLSAAHRQALQSVSLSLLRSFMNFFEQRARYSKFKSKHQLAKVHARVASQRKDDLHKLSQQIVDLQQLRHNAPDKWFGPEACQT